MPSNPPFPFGAGGLDDGLALDPPAPLAAPTPAAPSLSAPPLSAPRDASDLPFDLGGPAPRRGGPFDADTDGIPTGLPDLSRLADGPADAPIDDALALPSPSMIAPSPLAPPAGPLPNGYDDLLADEPQASSSIHADETEPDSLPPRAVAARTVPADVLFQALREAEDRATRRMAIAFALGCLASITGFVAARFALGAF